MQVHVCYVVLIALSEIFENLLQLKRFGLYFEGVQWLISYRNNEMLGGSGVCSPRKF